MTVYTELLAALNRGEGGRIEATIPEDWMQGRTTYGGLTAALCLEAARELVEDMPLRAAQVAFVGPCGGDVVISPRLLRRGKNTAYVRVDMMTETGFAAECIFTFGTARKSILNFSQKPAPDVVAPDQAESFFSKNRRPHFSNHFNVRLVGGQRPLSGASEADICLWIRHKDEAALYNATTLLSIADVPPPAAFSMLSEPAPISSMTWMAEFLTDDITTQDGWWLSRSQAQLARDGYSSQAMTLWNTQGEPIMVGRQTVAVFA